MQIAFVLQVTLSVALSFAMDHRPDSSHGDLDVVLLRLELARVRVESKLLARSHVAADSVVRARRLVLEAPRRLATGRLGTLGSRATGGVAELAVGAGTPLAESTGATVLTSSSAESRLGLEPSVAGAGLESAGGAIGLPFASS